MPELPEVETVKGQLNQVLPGLRIRSVDIRAPKVFLGDKKRLVGLTIDKVERVGKMIAVKFKLQKQKQNIILLIHLKLTGRLVFNKDEYDKEKHTHIIITFENGKKLHFWDIRKFGWMKIIPNAKLQIINYKLGVDPLNKEFTTEILEELVKKSKKPIKVFLMEQDKIAGVGNIYANEVFFLAKINPQRRANSLSKVEVKNLHRSLLQVLKKGLSLKGASDNSYRLIDGSKGAMQDHFLVYKRKGEVCLNYCGEKIRRIALGGRGTFFCPKCQNN